MGSKVRGLLGRRFTDQGPNTWRGGEQGHPILPRMTQMVKLSTGVGKLCLSKTLRTVLEEADSLEITLWTFFSAMKCLYLFWSFLREALYSLSSDLETEPPPSEEGHGYGGGL